mmetsp:Transcript_24997/g.58505  ORF Transcript_24997/g.58505 Transcript_24997/m.58505 type:complete len:239 (-) Transcript_24997:735-1451(-)
MALHRTMMSRPSRPHRPCPMLGWRRRRQWRPSISMFKLMLRPSPVRILPVRPSPPMVLRQHRPSPMPSYPASRPTTAHLCTCPSIRRTSSIPRSTMPYARPKGNGGRMQRRRMRMQWHRNWRRCENCIGPRWSASTVIIRPSWAKRRSCSRRRLPRLLRTKAVWANCRPRLNLSSYRWSRTRPSTDQTSRRYGQTRNRRLRALRRNARRFSSSARKELPDLSSSWTRKRRRSRAYPNR